MLSFMLFFRTAWDDYFTGTPTLIQSKEYGTNQTLSGTSVHVLNCLFKSTTSTSHGGALSCTSVTYLLVESTSFFSCSTSTYYGGAIYFSYSSGQCVLHEVCGYDCCSTYTSSGPHGQFAYIIVNNAASSKSYVNYSSITRCVNENSGSYRTLDLRNGNVRCTSINVSMNKCYLRSAISCHPYSDSNFVTCSFLYSSFTDNNATGYNCIYFGTSGAKYEIKSCNIIRNTQVSLSSDGTILTAGNLMITDSCILENTANYNFYSTSSSYPITISNCTVDSTSNNGYLTTQNTVTKSFILALKHMSTRNCHADYVSTVCPTLIIKLSCGNCSHLSQLGYLISLISTFLFNFIHLDSSNYPLY
jgi:hypothetical protein